MPFKSDEVHSRRSVGLVVETAVYVLSKTQKSSVSSLTYVRRLNYIPYVTCLSCNVRNIVILTYTMIIS